MIDLNEYFCSVVLKKISKDLETGKIDDEYLKEHITDCSICAHGLKSLLKKLSNSISPIMFLSFFKK